jgi:hypothetical protein
MTFKVVNKISVYGKKQGFNLFYQAQTTQGLDTKIGMMCHKQNINQMVAPDFNPYKTMIPFAPKQTNLLVISISL